MIYLFFFLKFRSQLRRTRPDIIRQLDETLSRVITDAGGKITGDRFIITAVFNEEKIGFWLDMYILIENLKKTIETSREYFGYSLVISRNLQNSSEILCRFLANYSGIFINENAAKNFIPYATFEKPSEWLKGTKRRKYGCGSYYKIRELKIFENTVKNDLELKDELFGVFKDNKDKNVLMISAAYSQIRSSLYSYWSELNNDFPVLSICFRSIGIGALVDAWSQGIRALSGAESSNRSSIRNTAETEEIDNLWELLFRERIRDEVSEYIIRCTRRFLFLVFNYYYNMAQKKKITPVLVLENINLCGNKISEIIIDTLYEFNQENDKRMIIFGIGENDIQPEKVRQWETVFDSVIKIEDKDNEKFVVPRLSTELWEMVYAVSLLGKYFSPELFQRLFEEEEINPIMINRAFLILYNLGIIDNIREPVILNRLLEEHSCKALGERAVIIKELVCDRLLNWAKRQNLNPCFRLLLIIAGLENVKKIDELLLLKSFSSDIINNTISRIDLSMKNGQLEELVPEKAHAMRYIYNTSLALHSQKEEEIEKIFSASPVENINEIFDFYPVLKTQILVNYGAWYLANQNKKEAAAKVKESIIIGQSNNAYCLPQAYRIFALVCLSKQQPVEAIEYLDFALSNAEKSGNYNELAISTYYSAAAKFLYGDIFNAAKLAKKSTENSLLSGRCEWADRSRFLEGRIEFDLGHYKNAIDIFISLKTEPYGNKTEEKEKMLSAWIYRCNIYLNKKAYIKPISSCFDTDLFEIEEIYFSGDYEKVFELTSSLENPFAKENYLYSEQAEWSSGFAQCEHLYYTNGEIQTRMIRVFRSLAMSKISSEKIEEAKQDIQKILRDEKLCEIDPWDAFYFYAKYLILEQEGADAVDMSTAVSMAFKRLQRRAGRIEDIETSRQYLNGPKWNSELSKVAREYKLI
jgi:hypothetical protein